MLYNVGVLVYNNTGRPLGDFINHYETLDYDTTPVLDQHARVRRSTPNSDHRIELNLKTQQRYVSSLWQGYSVF